MKRIIKAIFRRLGYKLSKTNAAPVLNFNDSNTMQTALHRLRNSSFMPNTIIDVGAAEGTWTEKAVKLWPNADFLLFEPLEERRQILNDLTDRVKNKIFLTFAAAGKDESEVTFYVSEDLDGSGIATNNQSTNNRKVKLTSIDWQVTHNQLAPPYAIKLDTHGFEVPILEGSKETLANTLFVIIECYGFHIAPGSLLFGEMCQYMGGIGFRLYDIVDTMRRPADNAFWQCDAFFIRDDNPVFESNTYK